MPERSDVAQAASPSAVRKAQLERLKVHPKLERFLDTPPSVSGHEKGYGWGFGGTVIALGAVIAFVVVLVVKSSTGPTRSGSPSGQALVLIPVFIIAIAAYKIFTSAGSAASFEKAPLRPHPCVIVDERVEVKGGGENSSAKTLYFATIEVESGNRGEYEIDRTTAGKVSVGDAGIAWVKGMVLIEFKRIAV